MSWNYLDQVEKAYNNNQIKLNELNRLKDEFQEMSDKEKSKMVFNLAINASLSKMTDREIQESIAKDLKEIKSKNSRISWWVTFWSVVGIIGYAFYFFSSLISFNY